jgi:hypothetical protein
MRTVDVQLIGFLGLELALFFAGFMVGKIHTTNRYLRKRAFRLRLLRQWMKSDVERIIKN